LFTGQRLDGTGLYYYGARYYDPEIGRFISPDTIIPDPANPQALNRYSYCINNPLKYNDPTGHFWDWFIDWASIAYDFYELCAHPSWGNAGLLAADVVLGIVPFVPAGAGPLTKAVQHGDDVVDIIKGTVNKADDIADAARGINKLDDAVKATFRGGEYTEVTLKPGDKIYRAYEAGNPLSNPISKYATDTGTASGISSTQSAIDELALGTTSRANPNRMVELEVTRPITVQYGLIEGGGKNAYQYYIAPQNFDALKITGERILK
jgi:RHS repeat-associated protein